MGYGLAKFHGKDWYEMGARDLVSRQARDGSWADADFTEGGCDTAFALLFLKRVNLLHDLTPPPRGNGRDYEFLNPIEKTGKRPGR
jgi:hypothetical protein